VTAADLVYSLQREISAKWWRWRESNPRPSVA
jgi:hypothetical protein